MRGLYNIGNTCFLNASIQCLAHSRIFQKYAKLCSFEYLHRAGVLRELCLVIRELWSQGDEAVAPFELLREIRKVNSIFQGFAQQDLHEVLLCMLDSCVEESSLLRDAFRWRVRSTLVCGHCHKSTWREDHVLDCSVSMVLDNGYSLGDSLQQLLDAHEQPETLGQGNEWRCEHCKVAHEATQKKLQCVEWPEQLVVHVKRFRQEKKLEQHVEFPAEGLRLSSLEQQQEGDDSYRIRYELESVVCHLGHSLDRGHYICYARMPDDTWAEFDDSRCWRVSLQDVLSSQAYVLVYRRQRHVPAVVSLSRRFPFWNPNQNVDDGNNNDVGDVDGDDNDDDDDNVDVVDDQNDLLVLDDKNVAKMRLKKHSSSSSPSSSCSSSASVYVIPLRHWCKLKTFSSPHLLNAPVQDWSGPVVRISSPHVPGAMDCTQYMRMMRLIDARRANEIELVRKTRPGRVDPKWAHQWLSFVSGKTSIPPDRIPDQEDKNPLWLMFKTIY